MLTTSTRYFFYQKIKKCTKNNIYTVYKKAYFDLNYISMVLYYIYIKLFILYGVLYGSRRKQRKNYYRECS